MTLTVDIKKKLHDYTLELKLEHKGGCLGILGPSGCGKSMGLKSIAGLVTPDCGRILLGDKTFYSSAERINRKPQLRKTGYLFQSYALFPNMTVAENVGSGISPKNRERDKIISACIHRFRLSGLENYYPGKLSGGQQQRAALARILASSPDLLLLDEPFSAMDAALKEVLRLELLHVLCDYHGLSILVTHDKDEAYQLCDSLIIMDQGQVLCSGATKDVFDNPGKYQAARLTGCRNISPVRRLGDNRILALDWNLTLTTAEKTTEQTKAVAIRPHCLVPVSEEAAAVWKERPGANLIPVNAPLVSPLPFDWEFCLENNLCWTVKKDSGSSSQPPVPSWLRVLPEDLLLLT